MQLNYCAFTGADDAVDPADLAALSKKYPFVEWSILYQPDETGTPRTPTVSWIRNFSEVCKDSHMCLHLCGPALAAFVRGDPEVLGLMKGFKRIQFNFEYLDAGKSVDPVELAKRSKDSPQWEFILQYGKKYGHYLSAFEGVPNHSLLFDGSAGEGVSPDRWLPPVKGHACGYAGGINPDNVALNLQNIARAAPGYATWIDMESGVRTNNVFDLDKVLRVLDIAGGYVPGFGAVR